MGIWDIVSEGQERGPEPEPEKLLAPVSSESGEGEGPSFPGEYVEDSLERITPQLADAIERALQGKLSSAPKRYGHAGVVTPRVVQMVMMRAAGYKQAEIARQFGISPYTVSQMLTNPDAKALLSVVVSHAAEHVLEIGERIVGHAGEMLDHIVSTVRTTKSDAIRVNSAFRLLEMAGHGAIERKQVETVVKVEGPQVSQLLTALNEAYSEDDGQEVQGKYEVLGSSLVSEETYTGPKLVDEAEEEDDE